MGQEKPRFGWKNLGLEALSTIHTLYFICVFLLFCMTDGNQICRNGDNLKRRDCDRHAVMAVRKGGPLFNVLKKGSQSQF